MCVLFLVFPLLSSPIFAADTPTTEQRLTAVEAAAKSAQLSGDNAWMLVSAALVLMMTGPGLALFYSGLVRQKNVLGTMMHSFVLMAVVTVSLGHLWVQHGVFGGQSVHWRFQLSVSA
jgi:Amt family ammonium transporter